MSDGDVNETLASILFDLSTILIGFSLLALLVMNFDRYFPIFYRASATKGKLFTLLEILIFVELVLQLLYLNFVIFYLRFFTLFYDA